MLEPATLQMCVNIEPHQHTEHMTPYQRIDGQFLRRSSETQHAPRDVIRSYIHDNEAEGTVVKFKVLHWEDFKNRTERDLEYVAVIPSGSIVYCSLGPRHNTCMSTFLNGSSPLRYIVEGLYTCVSFYF